MAIDEHARNRLYRHLEELLGSDDAETLMAHLPPVGWGDVATKQDLALVRNDLQELERRMELRFETMEHKLLGALRGEMVGQTRFMVRTMILANAASVASVAGLAFAAAKLT
jgi:hypothetical protein